MFATMFDRAEVVKLLLSRGAGSPVGRGAVRE